MKAIVNQIIRFDRTSDEMPYVAIMDVDGAEKRFVLTVLNDADVTWDCVFDRQFLRDHVNLGIAIMNFIADVHDGQAASLPKQFSD
jgi:hypothetical protein